MSYSEPGPLRLSRKQIELFAECPRCFYREVVHGVGRIPTAGMRINIAVDFLMKREFDAYRVTGTPHPLMIEHAVDAVPFGDAVLSQWRNYPGEGLRAVHRSTAIEVFGFVDDIWNTPKGELIVVDYKATAPKPNERRWPPKVWDSWKRQAFIYQWLLRANGYSVEDRAYFVHAEGDIDAAGLGGALGFELSLLTSDCSGEQLEPTLREIRDVLGRPDAPQAGPGWRGNGCDWCSFLSRSRIAEERRTTPSV